MRGGTSLADARTSAARTAAGRGDQPALYLGGASRPPGRDKHARRADRERHELWGDARRASPDYDCYQRTQQRQAIGRAVLDWWRETGGPLTAMGGAVEHTGAGD